MKNLLIILSFLFMFIGSCMTSKDPIEMKLIRVSYMKSNIQTRWINGQFREVRKYLYRGDNNVIYCIDDSLLGNVLYVER